MSAQKRDPGNEDTQTKGAGEWRIAENRNRCAGCENPFGIGDIFFSEIRWVAPESAGGAAPLPLGIHRIDFCDACWPVEIQGRDDVPIFWRARRKSSKKDDHVVDLASLQTLFVGLLEDRRIEVEALRYVVGLMLMRKRILKQVRVGGMARGDLVFRDPRDESGQETLRIATPDLTEESLEQLKEQLGQILS
jgi:hypothetical protein